SLAFFSVSCDPAQPAAATTTTATSPAPRGTHVPILCMLSVSRRGRKTALASKRERGHSHGAPLPRAPRAHRLRAHDCRGLRGFGGHGLGARFDAGRVAGGAGPRGRGRRVGPCLGA